MLAFAPGERPGLEDVAERLTRNGDIGCRSTADGSLELVLGAMAFDLRAAKARGVPPVFDLRLGLSGSSPFDFGSTLWLRPGPHVASGARSLPVLREWLSLAARLAATMPQLSAVGWTPARLLASPAEFDRHVVDWQAGGAFPSAVLCGFVPALERAVQSVGLRFVTGQEMWLEGDFDLRSRAAEQLGRHVAAYLAHHGPVTTDHDLTLPDGRRARIRPSPNALLVRVEVEG